MTDVPWNQIIPYHQKKKKKKEDAEKQEDIYHYSIIHQTVQNERITISQFMTNQNRHKAEHFLCKDKISK